VKRIGSFLIVAALIAGVAGCVSPEYSVPAPGTESSEVTSPGYDVTAPNTERSEVTSPGEETFTYVEVTPPDPDLGAALTGPINEGGFIHPSDLQRHSFFSGAT